MKRICFVLFVLLVSGTLFSQSLPTEKLVFVGSYNMSGLMTQFAQITIQSQPVKTSKKTYLHYSLTATTYSKWDSFFKIRDLYESYIDPATNKSSIYKRNILEGNYRKTEKYVFSNAKISSTSSRNGKPEVKKTYAVGASSNDIVTTFYRLRKIDFSRLKPNQIISLMIIFDDKEFPASVKYLGKETLKNLGNLGTRECYKLSVGANISALRGKDKNLFWLTADAKRIPVLIQFSIPVGTGQVKISSASTH